jgi:hypothetical protein
MNADSKASANRDALLEIFAAELTLAAYRVALRTRRKGTWLDLELDLWRAVADKVKTWGNELSNLNDRGRFGSCFRAATVRATRATAP